MLILPADDGIKEALTVLHGGGVVAHATETCYGLACDMTNPNAVAKLFAIKKRPLDMPVSALFASIDDAKNYVEWNALAEDLAEKNLPGPLTLILPLKKNPPHVIYPVPPVTGDIRHSTFDIQTIGFRISPHSIAHRLAQEFGKPISTTSANIHGEPNPYSIKDIPMCDLIMDSGTLPEVPPSRVVDCTGKEPKILRNGGAARHVPLPSGGDYPPV